jgi:hypothetical protein
MKDKEYDFNIYVSDGVVSLSAYQLEIAPNGQIQTRTDNYVSQYYPMTEENDEVVSYLLNGVHWLGNLEGWDEYDCWEGYEYLAKGNTPAPILEWVKALPEYEMLDLR